MAETVQMVAIHYANKSGRGKPASWVSIDAARELHEAGLAVWDKKCKYMNLTKTQAEMHRADTSLTMSHKVTIRAVIEFDEAARACVQGWAVGIVGRPHRSSPVVFTNPRESYRSAPSLMPEALIVLSEQAASFA